MQMIIVIINGSERGDTMQPTQRHSKKRDAIIAALRSTTSHPSAEWIYLQLKELYPDISLGTVYRNLSQFKQQGTIASLGYVNGVERFDGNTAPHVHFVCSCCGRVADLHNLQVPQKLCDRAGEETSARIDHCQLTFTGQCGECISDREVS